jgi:hypothetical protein
LETPLCSPLPPSRFGAFSLNPIATRSFLQFQTREKSGLVQIFSIGLEFVSFTGLLAICRP